MYICLEFVFFSSIFLICYTYLFYPLILKFYQDLGRRDVKAEKFDSYLPYVTMVVTAYNEEKIIEEKLKNILDLDYPKDKMNVIIASDGSNDHTNEIVKRYESKSLKLIEYPRMGKVNVLNKTVTLVSGEIIVFSDANTMYNSQAIRKLVVHFQDVEVGCVCGKLKLINSKSVQSGEGEEFYWRYETWIKEKESRFGCVTGANGAIYAIRRNLFEKMPSNVINDDFHISMKIMQGGYKVIYESDAIGVENVASDFKGEFLRHVRDGAGHYREIVHLTGFLNPMKGARFFTYVSHRFIRWMVPFLLPLSFVSNVLLSGTSFYRILFLLQIFLYLSAIMGFFLQKYNVRLKIFNISLSFFSTNLALMIGFWRNVVGVQSVTWNRTER